MAAQSHENEVRAAPTSQVARTVEMPTDENDLELFVERFNNLQEWEQTMILSSLQRLVTMMDAKSIEAAAILSTTTIDELATNSELEK